MVDGHKQMANVIFLAQDDKNMDKENKKYQTGGNSDSPQCGPMQVQELLATYMK